MQDNSIEHNDYFFKKELTFNLSKGIFFSLLLSIGWFFIQSLIIWIIKGNLSFLKIALQQSIFSLEYFLPIIFVGILLQEIIKSIILRFLAHVKWKEQRAGFSFLTLLPFIESRYPISIAIYKKLLIVPTIIIIQLIWLTYFYEQYHWLITTSFWIFFSGFDILSFIQIRQIKNNFLASTHYAKTGVIIYDNPFENIDEYESY
ncbi:MAG: hypothetical protein N2449_04050 [Bacteroidales bacterium]|nr:hypothetical protein [Bacteroidales bacterium]